MNDTAIIQNFLAARRQKYEAPVAPQRLPPGSIRPANSNPAAQPPRLDNRHLTILQELVQRPTWTLDEVRELTSGLMPLACLSTINTWAIDTHGDVLFEGAEKITVNINMLQKLRI